MGIRGRTGANRRVHRCVIVLPLMLGGVACAGDDDSDVTAPPPIEAETTAATGSTTADCSDARHLVVFDVFGTLTLEDLDLSAWVANPSDEPPARTDSADVASAYYERGYELMYVTTATPDTTIGDVDVNAALTGWLDRNGFPTGDRTRLWTWDSNGNGFVSMVDELVHLGGEGVSVDAGYTDNAEVAHAMSSSGVPADALWTMGTAAGAPGTTTLPDESFGEHVAAVESLGRVCEPA